MSASTMHDIDSSVYLGHYLPSDPAYIELVHRQYGDQVRQSVQKPYQGYQSGARFINTAYVQYYRNSSLKLA